MARGLSLTSQSLVGSVRGGFFFVALVPKGQKHSNPTYPQTHCYRFDGMLEESNEDREQHTSIVAPDDGMFEDRKSAMQYMHLVASEGGIRKGKLLVQDLRRRKGGNIISVRCVNLDCQFSMCAKKRKGGYYLDDQLCITEHCTFQTGTNLKQPCIDQSSITTVIMIILSHMISYD